MTSEQGLTLRLLRAALSQMGKSEQESGKRPDAAKKQRAKAPVKPQKRQSSPSKGSSKKRQSFPPSASSQKTEKFSLSSETWHQILQIAEQNAILPVLFDTLIPYEPQLSGADQKLLSDRTLLCVRQYYYLSYLTSNIVRALWEEDIPVAVFKGVSAAAWYPKPAYRKSGDIDLFLLRQQEEDGRSADLESQIRRAQPVLSRFGFTRQPVQTTTYHVVFMNTDGMELELHKFLSEPFENEETNAAIWEVQRDGSLGVRRLTSEGETFYAFSDAGTAFSLLVHMLHHFMRAGFGLKFLADWVAFWNRHSRADDPAKPLYQEMVRRCGLENFSEVITGTCVRFLGLDSPGLASTQDEQLCRDLLEDIFRSGEFGEEDSARTVAVGGKGPAGYLREFHHRMKLNFPKASRHRLLYPILWGRTLARFLANNRRIRHKSLSSVLENAGERGELLRRMHLFE